MGLMWMLRGVLADCSDFICIVIGELIGKTWAAVGEVYDAAVGKSFFLAPSLHGDIVLVGVNANVTGQRQAVVKGGIGYAAVFAR